MSEEIRDIEMEEHAVCEPVSAPIADYQNSMASMHDEIDDLDWDRMPIFGPKTLDEAIARINEAWKDRNNPSKWHRIDDLHAELKKRHPWL